MTTTLLQTDKISKRFGDVTANNRVDFKVEKGEVHALLGENGAGKSSLMNVLCGLYRPDEGKIFFDGKEVSITSPKAATRLGIGMIHQHYKLIDRLSALDNILLADGGSGFLNRKKAFDKIQTLNSAHGFNINLYTPVSELSMGDKQKVEILKVLLKEVKLLILDEPTTVLTPQEVEQLFEIMEGLKAKGFSMIFISHKLGEVMRVSDKVTILRKGESVASVVTSESTERELTDLMVGEKTSFEIARPKTDFTETALKLEGLHIKNNDGIPAIKDLSLELRRGEILGVAGISGHGQKELCEALSGIRPKQSGRVIFKGEDITHLSARQILDRQISISFVPEDRLGMGLAPSMDIVENILLKDFQRQGTFLDRGPSTEKAHTIVEELNVVTGGIHEPIRLMSGGNIQKILIGREIMSKPELIITAYPVRGLDIKTTHKIYGILNEAKLRGASVLLIAEDLDALMELSDRIMVLSHGENMGVVDGEKAVKEELGLMMLGKRREGDV